MTLAKHIGRFTPHGQFVVQYFIPDGLHSTKSETRCASLIEALKYGVWMAYTHNARWYRPLYQIVHIPTGCIIEQYVLPSKA